MTKIKFIILLILFLPCMNYGMKRKRGEDALGSPTQVQLKKPRKSKKKNPSKMAITFLISSEQRSFPKRSNRYFSKEEIDSFNSLIRLFPMSDDGEKCSCSLCVQSAPDQSISPIKSKSMKQHLLTKHIYAFCCTKCSQPLWITGLRGLNKYPKCSHDNLNHWPEKRDSRKIMADIDTLKKSLSAT